MEIIPAIDLIEGKCVRLAQGDYSKKVVYNEDPLETALQFEDAGIRRLHLVDLDGAKAGRVLQWKVLERLASRTTMMIDYGGGIKTDEDIEAVFSSGAAIATVGSVAVKQPELFLSWLTSYGPDRLLLGADVRDKMLATSGWLESSTVNVIGFLKNYNEKGLKQAFCTDISKDGMLQGPGLELYKEIVDEVPGLQLIASGGVSSMADLEALQEAGLQGAIVGKALYEGYIKLEELKFKFV